MKSPTANGIARVAYEATRAYSSVFGKAGRPDWLAASPRHHEDALVGVQAVLSGEARSGERLHHVWVESAAGGPFHSLPAPAYDQLSITERRKILLFRAVVLSMIDGPCSGDCHDVDCPALDDHACHLENCVSRFGVPPGLGCGLLGRGTENGVWGLEDASVLKLLS